MESYSVLMSVYEKENADYLKQSINSILGQTVLPAEMVIVCDGPLTESLDQVLHGFEQEREGLFQIVRLPENVGLGNALNEGLKRCKHSLVMRMDSDDIAVANRAKLQLELFAADDKLDICSGHLLEFVGDIQNTIGARKVPITHDEILQYSIKRCPFNHPAIMFRRETVQAAGGYSEEYHFFEDYYLWIRMLKAGCISANVDDTILYLRTSPEQMGRRGGWRYTKDMLRFHKWIRQIGWSSMMDYLTGAIPHAMVCLMPNTLRSMVYRMLHK